MSPTRDANGDEGGREGPCGEARHTHLDDEQSGWRVLPSRARALLERSRERADLVEEGDMAGILCEFTGGRAVALVVGDLEPLDEWTRNSLVLLARNALALVHNQVLSEERARLARSARRFVPDGLVRWIGRDDLAELDFADHRATDAWVLFCDLRGFTAFSAATPSRRVIEILREYYDAVGGAAGACGGTIKDQAGDGVLILVGAPIELADR